MSKIEESVRRLKLTNNCQCRVNVEIAEIIEIKTTNKATGTIIATETTITIVTIEIIVCAIIATMIRRPFVVRATDFLYPIQQRQQTGRESLQIIYDVDKKCENLQLFPV